MEDYKEKLRLAKEALDSGSYDKETIEYIFPELKESEDERIRRDIIRYLKKTSPAIGENIEKMFTWLEKQGEQKPAWSGEDSCCYDDICEILINLIHSSKSNVNKDVVQKDLDWLMSIKESQLKSTWSEEDEKTIKNLSNIIVANSKNNYLGNYYTPDLIRKLQSLCHARKLLNQEWSEEDEKQARQIERIVHDNGCAHELQKQIADWFKSLKERMKGE